MTIGEGHRNRPSRRLQKLIEAGVRALSEGDRPRAVECCETALAERPEMARAHYLAGLIATDSTDRGTAVQAFSRTVELNENHAGAWAQLARLRVSGGDFVKAEGCLKNAVNTFKGNTTVADLIGTAFRLAGNYDAALEWHKKAVAASSNHVPYLVNLANLHLYRGGLDDARGLLDRCLDLEPDNPLVHWLVSRCTRAQSEIHIEAMKLLLADVAEPRQAAYLHFATGKEYEDLEQWAPAFAAYDAGAVARRKSVAFDEAAQIELYERLASKFTRDWLANQRSDRVDNSPVFVVGLPRTGSTLLDRMLDAHPAVNSAGELKHLGFAVRKATGADEPRQFSAALMTATADADVSAIGSAYVDSTSSLRGQAAHVIDKLPSNCFYLPLILAALPNAKVLHISRGAMDTCFSIYKQLFADAYLYSYDLAELAREYVRYHRLMETWRARFGDRFYTLRYEDLVTDTEETLRSVLEHVGLSWNPACLAYFEDNGVAATQSAGQVREAPHSRSVGRWRKYERQLQPVRTVLENANIPLD